MSTPSREAVALAQRFDAASPATSERVALVDASTVEASLRQLGLADHDVGDLTKNWPDFSREEWWRELLAALVDELSRTRGDIDAPIPIVPDLRRDGPQGRFLFLYLFALCADDTREFLRASGFNDDVIRLTFSDVARHCATFRRKWATLGFDAGWWVLPVLRGEMVQIGSLQFHRVHLGVGSLSPVPWLDEATCEELGEGFRRGDPMIGLHIPQGTDLSPESLDVTFRDARRALGDCWPAPGRRLATCQTWMLDDRLADVLSPHSNILEFQRRFTLLADWREDRDEVLDFVFRQPEVALGDLVATTSLERFVVTTLRRGDAWRVRTGWFDFESPSVDDAVTYV